MRQGGWGWGPKGGGSKGLPVTYGPVLEAVDVFGVFSVQMAYDFFLAHRGPTPLCQASYEPCAQSVRAQRQPGSVATLDQYGSCKQKCR